MDWYCKLPYIVLWCPSVEPIPYSLLITQWMLSDLVCTHVMPNDLWVVQPKCHLLHVLCYSVIIVCDWWTNALLLLLTITLTFLSVSVYEAMLLYMWSINVTSPASCRCWVLCWKTNGRMSGPILGHYLPWNWSTILVHLTSALSHRVNQILITKKL